MKQKGHELLRKSEKYTKTDMRYFLSSGFWITFTRIIQSVAAFIVSIAFAHFISKDSYGIYKYIISFAAIIGAFTLTGLASSISQSVARGFKGVLREGFRTSLKWNALFILIMLVSATYYLYNNNIVIGLSLIIIGLLQPFIQSASFYGSYQQGMKDFKSNSFYAILSTITQTILLVGAMFFTKNVTILIAINFGSLFITFLLFYFLTINKISKEATNDSESTPYAIKLSLINILSRIAQHFDKVLIFQIIGSNELAIYSFAMMIPERVKGLIGGVSRAALPKFSNRTNKELQKTLPRKLLLLSFGIILIIPIYIFLAPTIFKILFPQYLESVGLSQVASLIILSSSTSFILNALFSQKLIKKIALISTISPIIQIICVLIGGILWGLMGVVLAQTISNIINTLIAYVIFVISKRSDEKN